MRQKSVKHCLVVTVCVDIQCVTHYLLLVSVCRYKCVSTAAVLLESGAGQSSGGQPPELIIIAVGTQQQSLPPAWSYQNRIPWLQQLQLIFYLLLALTLHHQLGQSAGSNKSSPVPPCHLSLAPTVWQFGNRCTYFNNIRRRSVLWPSFLASPCLKCQPSLVLSHLKIYWDTMLNVYLNTYLKFGRLSAKIIIDK